jgi:hypothetical protein
MTKHYCDKCGKEGFTTENFIKGGGKFDKNCFELCKECQDEFYIIFNKFIKN